MSRTTDPVELAVDSIQVPEHLLRNKADLDLSDLIPSIRQHGVLQPILVRPMGSGYELIAGYRRLAATKRVGFQTIPVHVKRMQNLEALEAELTENLARKNLPPHVEATGVIKLIQARFEDEGMTVSEEEAVKMIWRLTNIRKGLVQDKEDPIPARILDGVFEFIGRSFSHFVKNILPSLNYPEDVRQQLEQGSISRAQAQQLVRVETPELRQQVLEKVKGGENIKKARAEVMSEAQKARQVTDDLVAGERLEVQNTQDGWFVPFRSYQKYDPTFYAILSREDIVREIALLSVKANGKLVLVSASPEDVQVALDLGVRVWSTDITARFEGEHQGEFPPECDCVVYFAQKNRNDTLKASDVSDFSLNPLDTLQHLQAQYPGKAVWVVTREVEFYPLMQSRPITVVENPYQTHLAWRVQ